MRQRRVFISLNKQTSFFHFHRHYTFVQLNPLLTRDAHGKVHAEGDINKVAGK